MRKTCGDFGGITKKGTPCSRKAFYSIKAGQSAGDVPGRCITHRVGAFLSPVEKRFVEAYCGSALFNQTQAAIKAGCPSAGAHTQAYRMFKRDAVQAAINDHLNKISMHEAEILARLSEMARGDLSSFFRISEDGFVLDLGTEDARSKIFLIRKIKQVDDIEIKSLVDEDDIEDGDEDDTVEEGDKTIEKRFIRRRTEIELHDPKDALKELVKVRGMSISKHELTGAEGGPIAIDVGQVRSRLTSRIAGIASRVGKTGFFDGPSGNGGSSS